MKARLAWKRKNVMKKTFKTAAAALAAACLLPAAAGAQERFTVGGSIGLVSNYVWRGMDQNSGASVQPSLGLAWKGVSLSAWGSQSLTNGDSPAQEFDINLSYAVKGFAVAVSDLWWGGLRRPYGYYENGAGGNVDSRHHFEATLSCRFGRRAPLALSWSTWFAGADARRAGGGRCFSTYVCAACDISCPAGITLTPSAGFTPWKGYYHERAAFTDVSLKAAKDFGLPGGLSLPVFVQAVASPANDYVCLVAGLGLAF